MRQVSIKQLYSNLSKEMQDLPFEVTRKGKRVGFMVSGLDCTYPGLDDKPKNTKKAPKGLDMAKRERVYKSIIPPGVPDPVEWSGGITKAKQVGKK